MHRTFRKPWVLLGGLVACWCFLSGLAAPVQAQTCSPESRPLVVLLNGTTRLQLSSKKPIKTVINPKEGILNIRTVERDPTTVILIGQGPGITRIELEDAEGNREVREVLVQADVEYLHSQLRRAVPLSSIQVNPIGTNSVVLSGFVGRAEDINVAQAVATSLGFQVINGLRLTGVQQVQLDVVIARVRRTKGRDFGFNFIGNARQNIFGAQPGNIVPTLPNALIGTPSPFLQPTQFGPIINQPPGSSALFGGIIGNAAGFIGFLQALEREGVAKVIGQPRLVTKSGTPASFLDGGEQAVPVPAGLGQVGVQFEEFGTRLNFLPLVLGNGRIHLEVEPEISILDAGAGTNIAGATVPGRATQRVHASVEMESGQTLAIGGLIQRISRSTANKVPLLGQLPFFGALFSQKTMDEEETELVVLVTPYLVDAQSNCQVAKVLPGQETRTPDDFELFLEGILEAPRGPRAVFQGNRYVPAHRNGPTADLYPGAGRRDGLHQQPISPAESGPGGMMGMTPAPASLQGSYLPPPSAVPAPPPAAPGAPAALPPMATSPDSNAPTGEALPPLDKPGEPLGGSLSATTPKGAPASPTSEASGPPVTVPPPPTTTPK